MSYFSTTPVLTTDQLEKLRCIDKIFEALDVDDIKKIADREEIVAKLKGQEVRTPITDMAAQVQILQTQVSALTIELSSLRYDIQQIVKSLVKPYDYSTANDINSLKTKHNIY